MLFDGDNSRILAGSKLGMFTNREFRGNFGGILFIGTFAGCEHPLCLLFVFIRGFIVKCYHINDIPILQHIVFNVKII